MRNQYGILVNLILLLCSIAKTISLTNNLPRLLIISLDGFRHDYLHRYSLPTLNRIQNQGIKTKHGMQPTFVTLTFPNHISIATGMYQEDHGIIHNRLYDKELQIPITFDTRDEGQWSPKVEPLWITATKQDKLAGVLYWPACYNAFNDIRPLFYTSKYSDVISFQEKINNTISFFAKTSTQLVMLYHFEPDKQGHRYGTNANETYEALVHLDNDLEYLLKRVKNELNDDLNIIILSDHGMANTKQIIYPFEDYINKSLVDNIILDGPIFSVTPQSGNFDRVYNGLKRIPNVTVYTRENFPKEYHYANVPNRLGKIIVVPNNDEIILTKEGKNTSVAKGNHGYDNKFPSMQAIFMAQGPDFNQNMEIDSLKNVDVYHIACKILNLKPNPYATAGSIHKLTDIFRSRTNKCSQLVINIPTVLVLLFLNFLRQI